MRSDLLPVMNQQSAAVWLRRGTILALAIGALDVFVLVLRDTSDQESPFRSLSLLDAVLPFVLAFGVYRRSRVAACLLLAYWIFSKFHQLVTSGRIVTPLLGLLIVGWFFLNTVRAAFALHRTSAAEPDITSPAG